MPNKPPTHRPPGHNRPRPDTRPNAAARGYNAAWKRARKAFLLEHPLCAECQRQGKLTPATVVDHVVPHRGDMTLFWDGEWQSMCAACHSRKTAKEDGGFGHTQV